ncbi:MAG: SLC13 family permease [Gammaproteobacteria bacterium]|nr:SLC13 family permease [Gammaproteobacteria bacterium]
MSATQSKVIWLILGPTMALIVYWLLPDQYIASNGESTIFTHTAKATLALLVWMAVWWLSEATHITVTALLPIALFPLFSVASIKDATAPYASHIIFLFLGGFIIAIAIQRWNLDKRIALGILTRIGNSPSRIVGGFMLATAFLSAFISNTATTAMMLPIGLSVIALLTSKNTNHGAFATCIMLSIAYAANIGGIATVIGTAPNLFVASFLKDAIDTPFQQDIGFLQWAKIGTPTALILLPIAWWLLSKIIYKVDKISLHHSSKSLHDQKHSLGKMSYEEKAVCWVFVFTIVLWLSRTFLQGLELTISGNAYTPLSGLTDSSIAIFSAILLFLIPAKSNSNSFILEWKDLRDLPWGILILLGGGLSLAAAVQANGVTEFIGAQATVLAFMPPLLILLIIITAVVFLTELTSNTATTATLVPVLAAIAPSLNIHPYVLVIPAAIAASCAFMLPIATPPNAIVFGSGHIAMREMRKSGIWLNLLCLLTLTALAFTFSSYLINLL